VPQANLFIGGVCHGNDKVKVFQELNALIRIELSGLTQEILSNVVYGK
jgi:hypothetical protein